MNLLIILFFCIILIKADLPVHCIASDIVGEWTFFVSNSSNKI